MIDAGHVTMEVDGSITVNAQENKQHLMGNIKEYWPLSLSIFYEEIFSNLLSNYSISFFSSFSNLLSYSAGSTY